MTPRGKSSPLAQRDPAAATALLARLRAAGLGDGDIAGYAPRWHGCPVPPVEAPPGFAGKTLGALDITASRNPGVAAHFANGGVVHVMRMPAALAHHPGGWPEPGMEAEYVVLHEIPPENFARPLPATFMPALKVNERNLLVLG